jgi:DNA-binding CsgD family transcriptional regulator
MEVASARAERETVDRITRICASQTDATRLRVDVLRAIRDVVGFDAHVWLLTDPETTVGSAPLADVPSMSELPLTIRLKYLTETNRWTRLSACGAVTGTLLSATGGDPNRSLLWRGVLSRYGIGDVASVVFANRQGIWGFLDLWRNSRRPPVSARELDFLTALATPLTSALQRCQAGTLTAPALAAGRELGPMVFLLDDDLNITSQTPATTPWLQLLLPPAGGRPPVPASVYNVAAQLLAIEQGVDTHAATTRVHLSHGLWVTLRAARLTAASGLPGDVIAVTMEEAPPVDRLEIFSRAYALSDRERELLRLVATGADTKTLATRMYLAENTVQDHLKSIFAKTSARSRQSLLARAVGVRGPDADAGSG